MSHEGKVCLDAGKAEGRYANYLKVGHNAFEFVLDFSQLYSDSAKAELCARIITSPVEVTIHRPTVSLGNILSKYKVKGEFPEVKGMTEDFSPIAQKLEMLLQDKEAAKSLKRVERDKLKLQPVWKAKLERRIGAKGLFRGFYEHTEIPGAYRLDFKVKGVGSQCGIFERTESRTVFVQARPDKEATKIKGIYKEKEGRFLVTMVPTDKFGNLVGPGYSEQLQCRVEGKPTGKVIDKLDGSYQIELKILKKEDLNRINAEVNILGEKIYDGLFSKLVQIESRRIVVIQIIVKKKGG